jgi:hypothetical protein
VTYQTPVQLCTKGLVVVGDLVGEGSAQEQAVQEQFWQNPSYVPLGMYDQPTGFRSYLQDVRDGWPQFYGVRRL